MAQKFIWGKSWHGQSPVPIECEAHEDLPEEKQPTEEQEPVTNSLSISLPRDSLTDAALENLDHLLESKGGLIKKAFGIEEAR